MISNRIKKALHNLLRLAPRFYAKLIFRQKEKENHSILRYYRDQGLAQRFFDPNDLEHKGNTCFVLGSGATLNDLSPEDWEKVKSNFSIGFNFSFLLDHVPDLYFLELAKEDRGLETRFIESEKDYSKSTVVLKGLVSRSKLKWATPKVRRLVGERGALLCKESSLPTNSPKALRAALDVVMARRSPKKIDDVLVQSKASISMLVDLAARLGYQNIVLLGIDLQGPYFYESFKEEIKTGQTSATLLIQKSDNYEMSIYDILKIQSEKISKVYNATVYAGSSKSLLSEYMPIYSFE